MLKAIFSKLRETRGDIGKQGEDKASAYLKKLGYTILEQNYKAHPHEIDIICFDKQNQELIFVEVKTRINDEIESSLEAFTTTKKKHIKKCAEKYIATHNHWDKACRFDLICVNGKNLTVEHFKNVLE